MPTPRTALLLFACACASCEHRAVVAPPPPILPAHFGRGRVLHLERAEDVPLKGPRVTAEAGDWLLTSDGHAAVVSTQSGAVVDFGEIGGHDELYYVEPSLFLGLSQATSEVVAVDPIASTETGAPSALHVTLRVALPPIEIHAFYSFDGPVLTIETTALALAGKGAGLPVVLGEVSRFGNVPFFVEGHGVAKWGGVFSTAFLARDSLGVAYALGSSDGRLHARVNGPDGPGYWSGYARTGERYVITSTDVELPHRVVRLTTSSRSIGDAVRPLLRGVPTQEQPLPEGLPPAARVEIARCAPEGGRRQPFAPFSPRDRIAVVPFGCFEARVFAPGYGVSSWVPLARARELHLPEVGTLAVRVTEGGKPIPARVQVRGVEGTASPDWGEDPDDGAALNVLHPERGTAEKVLPPGHYRVIVDRGFEYGVHEERIEISAGARVLVAADLTRVVETPGWISADLHLHAHPSSDAPQPLADRVRAVAAAGVEVAVATDHNRVTDYAPAARELGVGAWVATVVGDEVTTWDLEFGHFNVFPLEAGSKPLLFEHTMPRSLLSEARSRAPFFGSTIAQINHPRMGGIGYFQVIRLPHDELAQYIAKNPEAPIAGFDALEVYNGDDYVSVPRVEEVLADWVALGEAGVRITATGNSDSHKLAFHEAGVPRTYVQVADDSPARFDQRAFVEALRAGRATVSGGVFLKLKVGDTGIGGAVPPGEHTVAVHADAPPWVDIDAVEIWKRGKVAHTARGPFASRPIEVSSKLRLAKGDFVFAIARGKRPMTPLFRAGGLPFSFTNPVWVR